MSVYIIAEAGVNHNGDINLAKNLIDKAKEAGADCIKFQTYISKNIVSKIAEKAHYQKEKSDISENQFEMLKKLELSFNDFKVLKEYCELRDIEFLSTAFDLESVDFLNGLGMRKWKIPSGDITNLPYLIKIAKLNKPVIISTGMSNMEEIKAAVQIFRKYGTEEITVLHCTTEYPAPFEDVNLNAMNSIKKDLDLPIGYSDHTKGIEIPIAAVAMGATIIEKHFTLDKNMQGPDHKASLEPEELKVMITSIRNVEAALGKYIKRAADSEKKNIAIARKSIIANCNIKKGEVFTEQNMTTKRPGSGISPMRWFEILGKEAYRDFEEDELIEI